MSTRRKGAKSHGAGQDGTRLSANGVHGDGSAPSPTSKAELVQLAPAFFDFYTALTMVFGGCCTNVISYEQLLNINPRIGSALTFSQMLFITLQSLPSFLIFPKSSFVPRLKPRQVPLSQWALQVLVLTSGSLLNNWAFAYNVPLTIFIVFRSAGLPVSMILGYLVLKKRYTILQFLSVCTVTAGVVLVTLSRTAPRTEEETSKVLSAEDLTRYFVGISMMTISLFCTGWLGLLQERTYTKYGPCWKEGVFYTHVLSLPIFIFLGKDVKQGILSLSTKSSTESFAILAVNLVTQLICVSGVNRLTSQVSSVSTNIALTARKAMSLCLSIWWFGNDWNAQLGIGAFMVFFGSLLYTLNINKIKKD
ncbi:hypothetical protein CVT26_014115 [Gymnopilus dilepis]|uniref:Sugar phosphate transporter domain-containing protein n=1 Tax=Gymnopilus dilepis TaxID=231916 RepID=A0A409Y7X5_9AGAR|nr:hypothetical protein CVT26_014115 [Gymnopilus dilepis]